MQIWLILGRSKKCLHIFPLSCLGGGILHAVVSFHLAQLVILLLSALCIRKKIFHCGFVNCVKSQRSVNSNLPLKTRISSLCRTTVRRRKASLRLESQNVLQGVWQFVCENFLCTIASCKNYSSPTQPHKLCLSSATSAH